MPHLGDLDQAERDRYHAAYCGVCRALEQRHGQLSRFGVTYDMTFLALVLGSLYEPDETSGAARCPLHPVHPQAFARSRYAEYAADMTVALVYHKCLDDWRDDRTVTRRAYAGVLGGAYRRVADAHPRQVAAIETGMRDICAIEDAARGGQDVSPDAAANCFGALLGEVFVCHEDFWADGMRALGVKLGKFVYVMDAALDMDDDRKTGSYNPLVTLDATPADVHDDLRLLAADVAAAFERLPLERDVRVLRSVLYAGMWQRYFAQAAEREKRKNKTMPMKETRRG